MTRTAKKKQELLARGADHVVVMEEEDLRVREITAGLGARIVFDPVSGPYIEKLAEAAALAGTIFIYGGLSGQVTPFPLAIALPKALTLRGYPMVEVRARSEILESGLNYVRQRLQDGRLAPVIAKTFPFAKAAEAYEFLASNEQLGKVVVTV